MKNERIYEATTIYDVVYNSEKPLNKSMIGKLNKWYMNDEADLFEVIGERHVRYTVFTKFVNVPIETFEQHAAISRRRLEDYLRTISKSLEIKKETNFLLEAKK